MIEKILQAGILGVTAIVAIMIIGLIMVLPTFFLWNWLMPVIFALPTITFWQALGICLLSGILFKNNNSSK